MPDFDVPTDGVLVPVDGMSAPVPVMVGDTIRVDDEGVSVWRDGEQVVPVEVTP